MAIQYTYPKQKRGKNKFQAIRTVVDGIVFPSGAEAKRYGQLKILERAGKISNLRTQVKYELIPTQKWSNGKVAERACNYIADFVYDNEDGRTIVEDVKGCIDSKAYDLFVIKRKLMRYKYGIQIVEVHMR